MENKDKGLIGNENIEDAIVRVQKEPSVETLAHALTMFRKRMNEKGQFVIALKPGTDMNNMQVQLTKDDDGRTWWMAFTGFDEELRGGEQVMSTFLVDIRQLFLAALASEEIDGIIINPWSKTMRLDKNNIRIILGQQGRRE